MLEYKDHIYIEMNNIKGMPDKSALFEKVDSICPEVYRMQNQLQILFDKYFHGISRGAKSILKTIISFLEEQIYILIF